MDLDTVSGLHIEVTPDYAREGRHDFCNSVVFDFHSPEPPAVRFRASPDSTIMQQSKIIPGYKNYTPAAAATVSNTTLTSATKPNKCTNSDPNFCTRVVAIGVGRTRRRPGRKLPIDTATHKQAYLLTSYIMYTNGTTEQDD